MQGEFFALKGYSNTDDISRHFSVHNFERNGDHIVFIIDGIHAETRQPFQIKRRYKHFLALRTCFVERLPGLYIPSLPKKQSFGNKEKEFLKERCYLLTKFLQQLSKCPYLFESEEFHVFIFPKQDIET